MSKLYMLILFMLMFFSLSCGKRDYESNAALVRKAITSGEKGDWSAARELAYRAVSQNAKDANARVILALALEQCEQEDQALEEIEQAVVADPENFMAQYTKGRMLFKKQRYEDCPGPLAKANAIKPDMPQTLLLLARTNAILDVQKEAINYYIALARHDEYKNKPEPFNELGVLFMKKQDYKMALRFFREAYSKDSSSLPVNINMAVFWDNMSTVCGEDREKAASAAVNAVNYYLISEKLLLSNPQADPKRQEIIKRIRELKSVR